MRANILSASAGSGKTFRLAYKYIRDTMTNPLAYRNILAVTFTNKATEEMKSRIIGEIHLLASGQPSRYMENLCKDLNLDEAMLRKRAAQVQTNILHDYSRFTVLTIDRFFQRVLRAFIRELGLETDYSLELDSEPILEKSVEELIKGIDSDKTLRRWVYDFCRERTDDDRSWDVREAITRLGTELFKEGNRQAISNARPKDELEKIIAELSRRCEESQNRVKNLAEQAMQAMREAGIDNDCFSRGFTKCFESFTKNPDNTINDTLRKRAASDEGWVPKTKGSPAALAAVSTLQPLLAEIIGIHDRELRLWNTVKLIKDNFRSFALLSDLYDISQRICEEEKTMLLSETKHILSKFVTDSEAPFIYEKIGSRFERYMIDEFQDTSLREWENFAPLLRNAMAQSPDTSVLLVGDIKQSIYRWRGGDRNILQHYASKMLGATNTQTESLVENWRSLPSVVKFNNILMQRAVRKDNDLLNSALEAAKNSEAISADLEAELKDNLKNTYSDCSQRPRRKDKYNGFVDITIHDGEPPVTERIKQLLDKGFEPKDILILVREKSKGVEIARTLLDFKKSNTDPRYHFDIMTQEALVIGSAPVVKFVIATMALARNPEDRIQRAVYRRFNSCSAFGEPLTDDERTFLDSLRMLSPEETFERITARFGLGEEPQYTAYLQALHEHIVRFSTSKTADTGLFLEWWEKSGRNQSLSVEQSRTTIEITTIHKAKGLEKKVVIIPCCDWSLEPRNSGIFLDNYIWSQPCGDETLSQIGLFPVSLKKSEMAESFFAHDYFRERIGSHTDNINLLYVALTRAAESLHIFIPEPKRNTTPDSAGKLIIASIPERCFTIGNDGFRHLTIGEFAPPCPDTDRNGTARHTAITHYPAREAHLRLKFPSQRYMDEEPSAELSPRNFGILMHKAFAEAETKQDIDNAVIRMQNDAVISASEAQHLSQLIDKALESSLASRWFGGGYTCVRNENDIVMPHNSTAKRPDRVMIDGDRATVVDYKFGHKKSTAYNRQTAEYMEILRQMGYRDVEGYIWYVALGEIERIDGIINSGTTAPKA